jgi:peptidoglycan/LPS O-acetylase OafA/YrhL
MPPTNPHAGRYRPDIDGLRAVAILSVLAFHAFPAMVPGGFVGVDVFFVISGYLISTIILGDLARGRFSVIGFYARRIRRIFPALAVLLASCLVAGWFVLYADDYALLGEHVAGGAGFVSNLLLWSESGYFDTSSKLKPLLHLWSLGIEEQFYLLWPLLLFLGWRARTDMAKLLGAIAATSLLVELWMTRHSPVAAFYAPWARFWELSAGGLLAVLHLRHREREFVGDTGHPPTGEAALPLANLLSFAGLALIAIACVAFHDSDPYPGWRALLPVVGTCLLIATGQSAAANRWVLSPTAMRWIGQISYPLYLWHWPLLAFLNIRYPQGTSPQLRMLVVVASVSLAGISYYLVERPLRFGAHGRAKALGLLAAMAVLGVAGFAVMANRGFVGRFPAVIEQYSNYSYDYRSDARIGNCWLNGAYAASAYAGECVDPEQPGKPLLLLWGDSHAGRLYPGLKHLADGRIRIAEYARNACPPYFSTVNALCLRNNDYVLGQVRTLRPRVVVLFAAWNRNPHDDPTPDSVLLRLDATIARLRATGVPRIVVLGPAPQWNPALPKAMVDVYMQKHYERPPQRIAYGQVATAHELDAYLARHLHDRDRVTYLSLIDALCEPGGGCLAWVGSPDQLVSWDYGHLTTPGSEYVVRTLDLVPRTERDDW